MIPTNTELLTWVESHWIVITLALMFLKGVASATSTRLDDKISEVLQGMFSFVRPKKEAE